MALLTPLDPTEEVAQPALRPRSPTAEDPHPMIYTTCRGATPSPGAGSPTSPPGGILAGSVNLIFMSHCVAQPWGMKTGSLPPAGGVRAGAGRGFRWFRLWRL